MLKRPVGLTPISTTRTTFGDVEAAALCHGVAPALEETVQQLAKEAKGAKPGSGTRSRTHPFSNAPPHLVWA